MPKDATINARVDGRLKAKAEKVLSQVGISTTEAITMLLHQIVLRNGLPFDARIPNKETRAAMAELDAGGGEVFKGSGQELIDHILGARKKRPA
jgi:DNA-damage-inducible protein J